MVEHCLKKGGEEIAGGGREDSGQCLPEPSLQP
jgi:hypothetical protein